MSNWMPRNYSHVPQARELWKDEVSGEVVEIERFEDHPKDPRVYFHADGQVRSDGLDQFVRDYVQLSNAYEGPGLDGDEQRESEKDAAKEGEGPLPQAVQDWWDRQPKAVQMICFVVIMALGMLMIYAGISLMGS